MTGQLAPVENLVDQAAVLKHLNLNPNDVHTQALLAICQRYRLDPLLKHVVLIQGAPYITRDGYLSIAHSTRQLDGIEVLEEGEDNGHWWAKVAVHRKDMGHPFAYRGRYPKDGMNKQYGPEMAVKCAEVASLRRAFDVTGVGAADERWDVPEQEVVEPQADAETHTAIRTAIKSLTPDQTAELGTWWREVGLPPIAKEDRLSEAQADAVLLYLDTLGSDEDYVDEMSGAEALAEADIGAHE